MNNKPVPPAVAEFVAGERQQLIDRVAELEREVDRRIEFARRLAKDAAKLDDELTALKAQAALSAQQSASPEFCCELSYKVAKQAAWGARDLTQCKCDHNEYCEHCWPDDFKEGGKWYNGFEAQQSAPERAR